MKSLLKNNIDFFKILDVEKYGPRISIHTNVSKTTLVMRIRINTTFYGIMINIGGVK